MRKVSNLGDNRNKGWCVHCGGPNETRDHVPSLVFLDDPLPPDLAASPACRSCNHGFSNDEAYVACLIECAIAGSVQPADLARAKVATILSTTPKLASRLASARKASEGRVVFDVEHDRVRNVVLKLARCHAAYELNEPRLDEPEHYFCRPLVLMTDEERRCFEDGDSDLAVWPEVGSRAMERLLIAGTDVFEEGWLVVQEDRYRYRTSQSAGLSVRMVLREYLACEVSWD